MRSLALVIALLTTAVLAAPVAAQDPHPCAPPDQVEPDFRTEQVWFHEGETKVGNLADRADQAPAPFDTTAPAGSVTTGAGAGAVTTFGATEAMVADSSNVAQFAGTFDGCVDTLLIDLYAFRPTNRTGTGGQLNESTATISGTLTIDGVAIQLPGPLEVETVANETDTVPAEAPTLTYRLRFAVTDIDRVLGNKLDGDRTGVHDIGLSVTTWFVNTDNSVIVWDTTEVPSGMTFNGVVDETYTSVRAR